MPEKNFDKELDAFIKELNELRQDVERKKISKRLDFWMNILMVEVGILVVGVIILEVILIVKVLAK